MVRVSGDGLVKRRVVGGGCKRREVGCQKLATAAARSRVRVGKRQMMPQGDSRLATHVKELRDEVPVVASIDFFAGAFVAALEALVIFMVRVDEDEANVVVDRLHGVET